MTRALPPDPAPQRGAISKVQQFLVAWAIWSGCGFVIVGLGAGIISEMVGVQGHRLIVRLGPRQGTSPSPPKLTE